MKNWIVALLPAKQATKLWSVLCVVHSCLYAYIIRQRFHCLDPPQNKEAFCQSESYESTKNVLSLLIATSQVSPTCEVTINKLKAFLKLKLISLQQRVTSYRDQNLIARISSIVCNTGRFSPTVNCSRRRKFDGRYYRHKSEWLNCMYYNTRSKFIKPRILWYKFIYIMYRVCSNFHHWFHHLHLHDSNLSHIWKSFAMQKRKIRKDIIYQTVWTAW